MSSSTAAREAFAKVVRVGTIPTYDGARASVFCEVKYTEDGRLSITGVIGPRSSGNAAGGCGQIDMEFAHRDPHDDDPRYDRPVPASAFTFAPGWDADTWLAFLDVWKRWHLNDMHPGCEHQRAAGWREIAREEVTLYHWRLRTEVSASVRKALKDAEARLRAGESVALDSEAAALAALPGEVTTAEDVAPGPLYEPRTPLYDGGRPASERKALGWLRPSEHLRGILTKPCEVCGYAYGSAWQREEVPGRVLDFLRSLPPTDKPHPWGETVKPLESIGAEEFAAILERNGYHTASADVLAGHDWREATAYVFRGLADMRYDDGEARWLRDFVRSLHADGVMPGA